MNMKNKIREFFTLTRKGKGGFTLVELIVVIAILGILAGVAVPVYNGYIKKADKAADEQLLASLNKAFASACAISSLDHYGREDVSITLGGNNGAKTVAADSVTVESVSDFADTLDDFFEGGTFKVINKLRYDKTLGGFIDASSALKSVTFKGEAYQLSQSAIDAFLAAGVFSEEENLAWTQGRVNGLAVSYGDLVERGNAELIEEMFGAEYAEYIAQYAGDANSMGNATVVYVAEKTRNMSSEDAYATMSTAYGTYAALREANPDSLDINMVMDELSENGEDPLTSLSLLYGTISAYANSPEGKTNHPDLTTKLEDVDDARSLLSLFEYTQDNCEDGIFSRYATATGEPTDAFNTDIGGYIGALDILGTVSGGFEDSDLAQDDLWTEDEDVTDLLEQVIGN